VTDVQLNCALLIDGDDLKLFSVRARPKTADVLSEYMYESGFVQVYSAARLGLDEQATFYNPRWIKKELLFFIK
jgi:hypothetical protein